ncbi:MAG: tetratricopeptide repeat protein [Thermoguttaceae bacterium]|nr:tetratricopeptide repeat protein [Thermoguttaceae bacterium]
MKRNLSFALCAALLFTVCPIIAPSALDAADAGSPALSAVPGLNEPESEPEDQDDESADGESEEDAEEAPPVSAESVAKEIETAVQENSADDLLNLATEIKLSAESVLDLTRVIAYCVEAEKKGLEGENLEYCRQLKLSSELERGLAMSRIFMDDSVSIDELPGTWPVVRAMALADLEAATSEMPDLALAQLVVGRLQTLPDGDRAKGKEALEKAVELARGSEPDIYVEALKYLAMLEDETDKSFELLQLAAGEDPENPAVLNLIAVCLLDGRQEEKALETIEKALAADPDDARAKETKALILAKMGNNDEAIRLYDEANPPKEDNLISQIERGQFLSEIGEYDKAIDLYTRMIDESGLPSLYYLRAAAKLQKKEYADALKDVNHSIGMNPGFSEALRLKAMIYIQQERYGDAIPLLEKVRRQDPDDEGLTAQLAYTMAQNDEFTGGMAKLEHLLETSPDSLPLLRGKADIYLMYGRWQDAANVYERILELHPADVGSLNNYAWLLATCPDDAIRNGARALELATKAAEKTNFREPYILSTLAAAYAETGDFAKALELSEKGTAIAEKEGDERIDEFRNESESYRKNEPWRENAQKTGDASDPLPEEAADFF